MNALLTSAADAAFETAPLFDCLAAAEEARAANQVERALALWALLRRRFPDEPEGYAAAGEYLRDAMRLDEAEAILAEGRRRCPAHEPIAVLEAWIPHYRGDAAEAERRWSAARAAFPDCFDAYYGGGAMLTTLGRFDEADALYRDAFARFPMSSQLLGDFAAVAQARGDLPEAARRWSALHTLFPDDIDGTVREARALLEQGAYAQAEALVDDLTQRHPDHWQSRLTQADLAQNQGLWAQALERWEAIIGQFPGRPEGYVGAATALRALGRAADAERVIGEGLERFPGHLELERQRALDPALSAPPEPAPPVMAASPVEPAPRVETADERRELVLRFESLGDTAEFGLVQRRCGVDRAGLLRWASTPPDRLVLAFNNNLEGIGEPQFTEIAVERDEYVTRDRRYGMVSRTFTPVTALPPAQFTPLHLKRLRHLRRQLLEDLAAGEKIFVYHRQQGVSEPEARALFAAIRSYGGNGGLLCVTLEDGRYPGGTVREIDSGLMMGTLERFSTVDLPVEAWLTLCREAAALW